MKPEQSVVTYTRVSTSEQTVEPQRLELSRYAQWKELTIAQEYTDTISGTNQLIIEPARQDTPLESNSKSPTPAARRPG